jgi:hypothetical protein
MSTHSSIRVRAFIVAVALCTLFGMRAEAQALKATILGRITDSSGGAMPNAKVTVRNVDTGLNQSVTTDAQGRYNIPDLDIGNYEAAAEMTGFKKITHQNVVLSVGSQVVIDFSMEVGATTQSVVVEGEVTQVDTTSSSVGTLVEPTQLRELPLNGRNFTQLMLLAPGVQQSYLQGSAFSERGYGYSISGSKVFGQEFLIDNTDAVDFFGHGMGSGATGNSFGVDSLAEFQLLTNTYSAQYGGNGGVLNAVSKTGTNELHGSAYEFLRNSAIQTRNYFDPAQKPPFRRNQFGFSLGGPIKKNKAFFFVNYEGLRQFLGVSTLIHTPDQAAHQGYLPNSAGVETPVISPGSAGLQSPSSCTAVYTAASNCLLASIAPIVGLYPVATGTSAQGIGTYTVPNSQVASEIICWRVSITISRRRTRCSCGIFATTRSSHSKRPKCPCGPRPTIRSATSARSKRSTSSRTT